MTGRTVAIHQPNYIPWLGYFEKIHRSDVFVFLDDVEFTSGSWINRNKIKTPDGWTWLTIPVTASTAPIRETEIATHTDWAEEHWKSLNYNYGGAEYFDEWDDFFRETYDQEWTSLEELNRHLLRAICDRVGIEYEFVTSSSFPVDGTETKRLIDICEAVDADRYYSGQGAKGYTDEQLFDAAGIDLEYQSFEHPTYPQRFGEFVPNLSIVDLLMNVGADRTNEILADL